MAYPVATTYTSATATIDGGFYARPAWRRAILPMTWAAVGSNTLSSVDPEADAAVNPSYPSAAPWHGSDGQAGVCVAYSGGAWSESMQRLYVYGGGHSDYAGNEPYGIDIGVDAPAFARLRNPTGAIGNTGTLNDGQESSGVYFDGRPRSSHTYGELVTVSGDMIVAPQTYNYAAAGGASQVWRYGHASNDWARMDIAAPTYGVPAGAAVYIPTHNVLGIIPAAANTYCTGFDLGTYAWYQQFWAQTVLSGYNQALHDPVGDLVLVLYNGGSASLYDGSDFATTSPGAPITMTLTGGTLPADAGERGWCYDSKRDRYLSPNGTGLYVLTPPGSGSRKTGTWTLSQLAADGANTVTPSTPQANGSYGRVFYSDKYDAVGRLDSVTTPLYVMALS